MPNFIFTATYLSIPPNAEMDILGTMMFTMALLLVDVCLRAAIEIDGYLKATRKSATVWHILTALLWYGWGEVPTKTGKHRFLMSKGLREGLVKKLGCQYPVLFLLSYCAYTLPDVVISGWRVDEFTSFILASVPVLCELTSIVEKLNLLNADIIRVGRAFVSFVKSVKR